MKIVDIEALIIGRSDGGENPISTERALWRAILNEAVKLYEVKEIDVNLTVNPDYLVDNFNNTGLGINDMEGFAICNGDNGTRDRTGRTSIGYGSGYATIGNIGGSKDAVVVAHSHAIGSSPDDVLGYTTAKTSSSTGGTPINTQSTGESGTDKNMQPYIITLMIQRIA